MRDPERIDGIIKRLADVWKKFPHLRLAQIIGNAFPDDPYYIEDDKLISQIEATHKDGA